MKAHISESKNILSITFYKIDYQKVIDLLELLKVDCISIFIDAVHSYSFKGTVSLKDFAKFVLEMKESILIFDDKVTECSMDKEVETLSHQKILIDFNLGENTTHILINKNNVDISKETIKTTMLIKGQPLS